MADCFAAFARHLPDLPAKSCKFHQFFVFLKIKSGSLDQDCRFAWDLADSNC